MEYEAENKEMELRTVKSKIKERRFLRYVFDSVLGHPFRGALRTKNEKGKAREGDVRSYPLLEESFRLFGVPRHGKRGCVKIR